MSWDRGAGFRIVGAVVRRFVPPSGKCAFVTLAVPGKKGEVKHELRTFDHDLIVEVGSLGVGQIVQATGNVDNEPLRDKAKNDVQVDGRTAWVPKLTIRDLKIEGSSVAPKGGSSTSARGADGTAAQSSLAPASAPTDWDDAKIF